MTKSLTLFLYRVYSIPKVIKICFYLAFFSILLIELILKRYPAPSLAFYNAGDIYLKLCYALSAAVIFYFINQHLPREKKKLKSVLIVNNKIYALHQEVKYLLITINKSFEDVELLDITQKQIEEACSKINPGHPVISPIESATPFENWFEYFNYKSSKIKTLINGLLPLYDIIDPVVMADLYLIEDETSQRLQFDRKRTGYNSLSWKANTIYHIVKDVDGARINFFKKYKYMLKEHKTRSIIEKMGERYHPPVKT